MENIVKVGIDLGTTNTVACYEDNNGKPDFFKFGSSQILPSALYIDDNRIMVGNMAVKKGNIHPEKFIKSAKTHMGEYGFVYPNSVKGLSFDIKLTPTDVATYVLKEVKKSIDKKFPNSTVEAVITVPAYFNSNQIDETNKAGENAGFIVKRIVSEPTSAAVAYINENIQDNTKIFVVDFGGGTLDLTLLKYDMARNQYQCEALSGDNKLGGDNIDECLIRYFNEIILEDIGIDLSTKENSKLSDNDYYKVMERLRTTAIQTKIELSEEDECSIDIPDLFLLSNNLHYSFESYITREEFEQECKPIFDRLEMLIKNLIQDRNINIKDINRVLLVGGSCFIPKIREIVRNIFGQDPYDDNDLSKAVALGACIIATQELEELTENTAYDFGVEVTGDKFSTIIERNTPVPCTGHRVYSTTVDNQEEILVNVYERGGNINQSQNNINVCDFYGSLTFKDFKKGRKGEPKIDIQFDFDTNRRLFVTIKDLNTGKSFKQNLEKTVKVNTKKSVKPMDIFLLIDASGSMSGTPMDEAKKASRKLINDLIDLNVHRIGIIQFASDYQLISNLTHSTSDLTSSLKRINASGATYVAGAFKCATDKLVVSSDRTPIIIMLTDGYAHDENDILSVTKTAKNKGVRIITIGSGSDFNRSFLKTIASSKNGVSDMYEIRNMSELAETFENIVVSLQEV